MAGHSHWKNIKRTKEAGDRKRGLLFSKIGKEISLLAKEGGADIEKNPALRIAVEKAKEMNVPKENIERAIKRGTGELRGENLENFTFEAYGPGGAAVIAEGITDNMNRSISEFKKTISRFGGKPADPGSVKWLFDRKGVIIIENGKEAESLGLAAIEAGAQDFKMEDDFFKIYTETGKLEEVKKVLLEKGFKISSASLSWEPGEPIELSDDDNTRCEKLFEALEESEDIQSIYFNTR